VEEGFPDDPLGLNEVDRRIRSNEREEGLKDGESSYSEVDEGSPDDLPEELNHVAAYESAPWGTRFDQLEKAGVELPAPESLDDAALHAKLWEVINKLAELDVTLSHTDHLSDRELYEHLWRDSLREDGPILPPGSGWNCSFDILGGCSEEDIEIMLRYYETEKERQRWAEEFPEDVIPPHENLPFDRDRHLPRSKNELEWNPSENDSSDEEFDADEFADGPPF
jgi:hypothetical protein